jgi:predicted permease
MNLSLSIATVFPIFVYLLIGIVLRRLRHISDGTLSELNRIAFSYFFPFVMFSNIYKTSLDQILDPGFLLMMALLVLLVSLICVLVLPRYIKDKPVLGSVIQGIIRGNSILFALPVVSVISGPEHTGLVSLCIAIIVPMYNIICVLVLESLRGHRMKANIVFKNLLKNPVILGALAGVVVKVAGISFFPAMEQVIFDIARMVTPLSLIMLGAGLRLSDTLRYRRELILVSVVKLIMVPLLFVAVTLLLGYRGVPVTTAMALSIVPTAVSTFVMAQEMEADAILAGQIVAVTSVLSIITVFLWVLILDGLGVIA